MSLSTLLAQATEPNKTAYHAKLDTLMEKLQVRLCVRACGCARASHEERGRDDTNREGPPALSPTTHTHHSVSSPNPTHTPTTPHHFVSSAKPHARAHHQEVKTAPKDVVADITIAKTELRNHLEWIAEQKIMRLKNETAEAFFKLEKDAGAHP
jgi:hypothetical protein